MKLTLEEGSCVILSLNAPSPTSADSKLASRYPFDYRCFKMNSDPYLIGNPFLLSNARFSPSI